MIGPAIYSVSYVGGTGNDFRRHHAKFARYLDRRSHRRLDTASNWSKGAVPTSSDTVADQLGQHGDDLQRHRLPSTACLWAARCSCSPALRSSVATASTISGTLTVGVGASLTLSAATTVSGTLVMEGTTLHNAATLTVSGTFDWYDGTLTGAGSTSISSGATLVIGDGSITSPVGRELDQALTNAGTVMLDGKPRDHRHLEWHN